VTYDGPAQGTIGDTKFGCSTAASASTEPPEEGPPTIDDRLPLPSCPDVLMESVQSGGVGKDDIPSIDDPTTIDAATAAEQLSLSAKSPVFGVVRDGVARAYPQFVLVHHEIVNDVLAGDPILVTYCPLTGTAQGFERGDTEFGVSGRLLNSNLIMYDRATDSWWPQMLATAIDGPHTGVTLQEFSVTWTTWERWRKAHPETTVLSDETGFVRNYGSGGDPYGSYTPKRGHYANKRLIFPPYAGEEEQTLHPKAVVIGARSTEATLAVTKERLREAGAIETTIDETTYLAVHDPDLDTGYIYRKTGAESIVVDDSNVLVDQESYDPDSLPYDRLLRYDAMWFAWHGYYPWTALVQ
jgi:hypothetical protein